MHAPVVPGHQLDSHWPLTCATWTAEVMPVSSCSSRTAASRGVSSSLMPPCVHSWYVVPLVQPSPSNGLSQCVPVAAAKSHFHGELSCRSRASASASVYAGSSGGGAHCTHLPANTSPSSLNRHMPTLALCQAPLAQCCGCTWAPGKCRPAYL